MYTKIGGDVCFFLCGIWVGFLGLLSLWNYYRARQIEKAQRVGNLTNSTYSTYDYAELEKSARMHSVPMNTEKTHTRKRFSSVFVSVVLVIISIAGIAFTGNSLVQDGLDLSQGSVKVYAKPCGYQRNRSRYTSYMDVTFCDLNSFERYTTRFYPHNYDVALNIVTMNKPGTLTLYPHSSVFVNFNHQELLTE